MTRQWWTSSGPAAIVVLVLLTAGTLAAKGGTKGKPPSDPEPLPDTHAIVYVNGGYQGPMRVMDLDGANDTLILDDDCAMEPSYSPGGERVAFQTTTGGSGLWIFDLDGSGLVKIASKDDAFTSGTSWSAVECPATRTELIAFTKSPGVTHDLWVVAPDGSGLTNLTQTSDLDEFEPCWNRTAERIVLTVVQTGDHRGENDIYIFEIGAGPSVASATNITASGPLAGASVGGASFAHTSDLVVVEATLDGESRSDIWLIDPADPGNPFRVTDTPDANEQMPCWSNDDSRIIMRAPAARRGTACLFSINLDGTDRTQLGNGRKVQSSPDCRP